VSYSNTLENVGDALWGGTQTASIILSNIAQFFAFRSEQRIISYFENQGLIYFDG
jgi:hypothetical protein